MSTVGFPLRVSSEANSNTTKNPKKGMMNGMLIMWVASAIRPINRNPQPPIGVIISSDEALLVRLPKPRSDS